MKQCPWCHGSGLNKADYGPVPCPDCKGTGYVDEDDGKETGEECDHVFRGNDMLCHKCGLYFPETNEESK